MGSSQDQNSTKFAVFVPATPEELDRIILSHLWWSRAHHPSNRRNLNDSSGKPDLIYLFPGEFDGVLVESISSSFNECALSKFFSCLRFEFAELPPSKNHYIRSTGAPPPNEYGLKSGPNYLFFHLIRIAAKEYQSALLLETDCIAVKSAWLDQAQEIAATSGDAWVMGSKYAGPRLLPPWTHHLNGNAIYQVGDGDFLSFFDEFLVPRIEDVVKYQRPELAFDCAWEEYKSNLGALSARQTVGQNVEAYDHRFQEVEFIKNLAPTPGFPRKIESLAKVTTEFPEAYLLHASWLLDEVKMEMGIEINHFTNPPTPPPPLGWIWIKGFRLTPGSWLEKERFYLTGKRDYLIWSFSPKGLPVVQFESDPNSSIRVELYSAHIGKVIGGIHWITKRSKLVGKLMGAIGDTLKRIRRWFPIRRRGVSFLGWLPCLREFHLGHEIKTLHLDLEEFRSEFGSDRILVIRNGQTAPSSGQLVFTRS